MPLHYEKKNTLDSVLSLMIDYAEWCVALMQNKGIPEILDSIEQDIEALPTLEKFQDFRTAHEELKKISAEKTQDLQPLFDAQLHRLKKLARKYALIDSGFDPYSGLKNRETMEHEVAIELERLARRGNPFVLAVSSIDHYTDIERLLDKEQMKVLMARIGQIMMDCARNFDDAYRFSDKEFVLCLKLTDPAGGRAAIGRLRAMLEKEQITVPGKNGEEFLLTMSFCVASPVPGDTITELLENMREDLDQWKTQEAGSTIEYVEVSPLQRYLSSEQ